MQISVFSGLVRVLSLAFLLWPLPGVATVALQPKLPLPKPPVPKLEAPKPGEPTSQAELRTGLAKEVQKAGRAVKELSVHVVDLQSGQPVFNHYANRSRIIASNTKLFTTAAALDRLGPGFAFETPLLIQGAVRDGVLEGGLAVVGSGDPNFSGRHFDGDSFAVFRPWARALRELGVREVAGDTLLVHGLFRGPFVHPDWPREQLDQWYEAPVASLSFNDSCVLVRVFPGPRPGAPARVETVPPVGGLSVTSTAQTAAAGRGRRIRVHRRAGDATVQVEGRIALASEPVEAWVTVENPVAYFGLALRAAFEEEGIRLRGLRPSANLPDGPWRRLGEHRTDLLTTLEVINKRSQNFYAESLLKTLGARYCQRGDWAHGLQAVREFLAEAGLGERGFHQADGSGMSRENRFTARQVTTLLRYMYFHRYGREYLRSLAFSGEGENSWRKRLADPPYRGNVFAKTGSLRGVSALSGYAKAASGRVYAFSILGNGVTSDDEARRAQDALVRTLIDLG